MSKKYTNEEAAKVLNISVKEIKHLRSIVWDTSDPQGYRRKRHVRFAKLSGKIGQATRVFEMVGD